MKWQGKRIWFAVPCVAPQSRVVITPNKQHGYKHELPGFFDLTGIDMTFNFIQIKEPILSPSGKVGLKVKQKAETGKAEIARE